VSSTSIREEITGWLLGLHASEFAHGLQQIISLISNSGKDCHLWNYSCLIAIFLASIFTSR
jgi:hypothetical protein